MQIVFFFLGHLRGSHLAAKFSPFSWLSAKGMQLFFFTQNLLKYNLLKILMQWGEKNELNMKSFVNSKTKETNVQEGA